MENNKYLVFVLLLSACAYSAKKLIIKEIHTDKLVATWYRESYISNTRAFVSANIGGKEEIILDCQDGQITDINIKKDTIFIRFFGSQSHNIYSRKQIFDKYRVEISSVTYEEWNRYYHPELFDKKSGNK
ncbi:hypothetical protein [Mucilaginibacter sp.]|uniref:hypothetical protein n=1 Tax=Mucilaginibacter sp. TaxID=1882438 RepID=UPI0026014FA5|nr:hypothetical protein [Mucilaginibacter sp.]